MRFLMYAKTNGTEELFYDSESGSPEMSIAQPNLKLELSKAGTLEFTILPTHPMYDSFHKMKTYIRVMQDDYELFRGRVLEIEDTTYMERHIQCEGDLSYLIDSLQPPQQTIDADTTSTTTKSNATYRAQYGNHVAAKSSTIQTLDLGDVTNSRGQLAAQFSKYILQHNSQMEAEKQFTVGDVTMTDVGTVSFTSNSYRDTKSAVDSDLVKQYGGYLQTRKNANGPTYIDWLKQPGVASTQRIVLGVNLIDLQQKHEGDELFTIFVPIGDSDLTIASVNNGNIGIEDAAGIAEYGKIYKTQSYSGITDAAELKKLGEDYMTANCKPDKLSLTIKAVDMNLLDGEVDAIRVGSTVTVVSDPHDISVALTCISIEYDIQNPENNSYEIGDPTETLSQKTQSTKVTAAEATSAAGRRASRATSAASTLEDTVNRHAENIIDHADMLYKIEADLVQIHAKCIEITASEKVTITTDKLEVNANGQINVKANGDINMASGGLINLNDHVYLSDSGVVDNYRMYVLGSSWIQELTIGGHLHIADIEDENGAKWTTQSLKNFLSMYSASFIYTGGSADQNLEDAVKSFGTATESGGIVTIPFNTFYQNNAGNITFNVAGMAYYQNHIGIASTGSWAWNSDDEVYYRTITPNAGSSVDIGLPTITTTVGNWASNVAIVSVQGPGGHDITTQVVNASSIVGISSLVLNGPATGAYTDGTDQGTLSSNRYYQVVATPNSGSAVKLKFKTPSSGTSSATFTHVNSLPSGKTATSLTKGYLYRFLYTRNGSTVTDNYYSVPA